MEKYDFNDTQIWYCLREISKGLKSIHEKNISHRDLKMANILVNKDGYLKLIDFGSCTDKIYN